MAATVVVVTGDAGAGKSTVARLMEAAGGLRLDADALALDLWRHPDVAEAALARWGRDVLDVAGNVDRRAIAARIFNSDEDYRWCCGLLHPLVMGELARRVSELAPPQWAVAEVPLFFEAAGPPPGTRAPWATHVVFVTAPFEARLSRCREQRGWDEAELRRREGFFLPSASRMAWSDFVINNEGALPNLEAAVRDVLSKLPKIG